MKIVKCDICGKIINEKDEAYYDIYELTYHAPGGNSYRYIESQNRDQATLSGERDESWLTFADIHFCADCWASPALETFRDLIARRLGE